MRWGDGRRANSDFAREQILDAAWRCYQRQTVQKTRMEHIAREAKVSRTTIYRYFQSRDEVLLGVLLRAVEDLSRTIQTRNANSSCFAEFLVESLATAVDEVPHSAIFTTLLQETTVVASRVYIGSAEVFGQVCQYFQPHWDAAKAAGELRDNVEFTEAMDWIYHVLTSYVMEPSSLSAAVGWRSMLWRFLIPAIFRDEAIPAEKRD